MLMEMARKIPTFWDTVYNYEFIRTFRGVACIHFQVDPRRSFPATLKRKQHCPTKLWHVYASLHGIIAKNTWLLLNNALPAAQVIKKKDFSDVVSFILVNIKVLEESDLSIFRARWWLKQQEYSHSHGIRNSYPAYALGCRVRGQLHRKRRKPVEERKRGTPQNTSVSINGLQHIFETGSSEYENCVMWYYTARLLGDAKHLIVNLNM